MKRTLLSTAIGASILIGVLLDFATGAHLMHGAARVLGFTEPAAGGNEVYWCPMHPFYKVPKYGICPYCNMALEPYTPGPGGEHDEPVLVLTDQQIQQAGVRTERARKRSLVREILTSGILERNHITYWGIDVRFGGWIEELYIHHHGQEIAKGSPVARVYSPELYSTQNEYLLSRTDPALKKAARLRLELMGIDEREVAEIEKRGTPSARMVIRSPQDGVLTHLGVRAGMKIPENGHLAEIADLKELWLFADIYDRELNLVSVGQQVRIQVGAYPNETFTGTVDLIEPQVRAATQTARVRITVPNDPVKLLPGQFARVLLTVPGEDVLSVSEQSVIPTGRRHLVIVSRTGGRFVAREVSLGRRWMTEVRPAPQDRGLPFFTGHGRYHEVLSGVNDGDTVVTSGAFLLLAEAQIRQLLDKMVPPEPERRLERSAWSGLRLESPHRMMGLPFKDAKEHQQYDANESLSWRARSPKIHQAMGDVLRAYFDVHLALQGEHALDARARADAFAAPAKVMTEQVSDAFEKTLAARLRAVAEGLRAGAATLSGAQDAKTAQKGFGELSAALEIYLGDFDPPEGEVVQYYCGMARQVIGSPTEAWFQRDHRLGNPYGMPACGREERTFRKAGP